MLAAAPGLADDPAPLVGERLPPLHVGEWILRAPPDPVAWGDGKVYVLDLWGTWCAPCVKNIPTLTKLQAAYRKRGLVVIGYSWEKPATIRAFVEKMGNRMDYSVVSDPKEVTLDALNRREAVESFPYAFLVDRDGTVVWAGHPHNDDLPGALRRLLGAP
jgi:thiol-disulfide isomerase/thioredoxin